MHDSNSAARLALNPIWTFHDYELDLIANPARPPPLFLTAFVMRS